jgi:hypothetical protein
MLEIKPWASTTELHLQPKILIFLLQNKLFKNQVWLGHYFCNYLELLNEVKDWKAFSFNWMSSLEGMFLSVPSI